MIFSRSCIFKTRPTHTQIPIFENSDFYQRIVTIFFDFYSFLFIFIHFLFILILSLKSNLYQKKNTKDFLSKA
jgi:hypothetical protein